MQNACSNVKTGNGDKYSTFQALESYPRKRKNVFENEIIEDLQLV